MKKIFLLVSFCLLTFLIFGDFAYAQITPKIDYSGQPVVDSDLDGLTDQGEIQIYKTDPENPDTDGDGYYDGIEITGNADPLNGDDLSISDKDEYEKKLTAQISEEEEILADNETPWVWYISRISALIGFILLYVSIFLGLVIRIKFLHKLFSPLYAMNAHSWLALQATIFAFLHGFILVFDKFLNFTLKGLFLPFASNYEPLLVGLGTIAFYLMLILTITSYGRKYLSHSFWRSVHFLNIGLYFITIIHALYLGTDLKVELYRNIFIYLNVFLIVIMFINMFLRIQQNIKKKKIVQ